MTESRSFRLSMKICASHEVMKRGSSKPGLQHMALAVFKACREFNIVLDVQWRSRNDPRLVLADEFSRPEVDRDDWSIDEQSFTLIVTSFGVPSVDLFASDSNMRCEPFFTMFRTVNGLGRNAFLADWSEFGLAFACPPLKLIKAVLMQTAKQKAKVILVVPRWRSLGVWPLIAPNGTHFCRMITKKLLFWPVLSKGPQVISQTFQGRTPFSFLAFLLDGSIPLPFEPNVVTCSVPEI